MDTRRVVVRFAFALLALAAVGYAAGGERLVATVAAAEVELVAVATAWSLVSMACFMEVFVRAATVLDEGRAPLSRTYLVGSFARGVLPWGNVASATLVSYLLSRDADTGYERALAAVAADEFVTTVTSVVAVIVGATFVVTDGTGGDLAALATATASAGVVFVVGVLAIAHIRPRWLTDAVYAGAAVLQRLAVTVSPAAARSLDRSHVSARLGGFDRTIRSIATDRTRLAVVVAAGLLGWVALGVALHYSVAAVGASVPVAAAIAIAPLAALATVLPLPGGVGGVEAALVALVVPVTAAPLAVVAAGVLVYRLATFWLHLAVAAAAVAATPRALVRLGGGERLR